MFSIPWSRWIAGRFQKKSPRRRQIERPSAPPSLEWLEKRELLSASPPLDFPTPNAGTKGEEIAAPASEVGPIFGPQLSGYTPSQISQAYGFNQITFNNGTVKGNGSGQMIAIVDAYDDPNISSDLKAFDQRFGLTNPSLTVLNQSGGFVLPEADPSGDWEAEEALDVEWAHAMAPSASIVVVEANSDAISDLLSAVQTAAGLPGVSVVSMSWGDSEFENETSYDSYFTTPAGHTGVTFVAASGDSGAPPIYPAVSPNVLAVGGSTLTLDAQNNYAGESAWTGSGGGISVYEAQPGYQKGVVTQSATQRTNPDVAYNADPQTGFAVYDSYAVSGQTGPWLNIGGTSAGAPQWAALIAIADQGRSLNGESALDGPSATLPMIYQMPGSNFHDITTGASTGNPSYAAGPGYDLATGRGSPLANQVVNYLVNGGSPSPPPSPSSPPSGPSPSPPPSSNLIGDGNFAQPIVGSNQVTNPSGSPWNFVGWAGIAGIGSYILSGDPPPPAALQAAFLFNQSSSILQTVWLAPGSYTLSFQAAQANVLPGSQEQIAVLVDGMVVIIVTPGPNFAIYKTTFTVSSAGNYTIEFLGKAPTNNNAALLDNIYLESSITTSPPAPPSSPSPAASPTLDPSSSGSSPSSQPSTPSSSGDTEGQSASMGSQQAQSAMDAMIQAALSYWYNLLNSELQIVEAEWNQLMQLIGQWEWPNRTPL